VHWKAEDGRNVEVKEMKKEMMKKEKDEKKRRNDGEAKKQLTNILFLLIQCSISYTDSRPCRTWPKQPQSERQTQSVVAAAAAAAASNQHQI
jgi:hypothetical protein